MNHADVSLAGWRFDGRHAAKEEVAVHIAADRRVWLVRQAGPIEPVNLRGVRLTEPFQHSPLLVHMGNGSHVELAHGDAAYRALVAAGAQRAAPVGLASALARDWRAAVLSLLFLAAMVAAFYVWLLPAIAATAAPMVPAVWKQNLGVSVLSQLDATVLQPSELPLEKRQAIEERFADLVAGDKLKPLLHLRRFSKGPNAFALPGGHVVLTDELVKMVDGDVDVITGVLAHELGHIKHEHGLRMVIQATALSMLGSALIGDYSAILATAPAVLGQLQYSREFETQADRHSHELLCALDFDPARTAGFFDKVVKMEGAVGEAIPLYLRSHPDSGQRSRLYRSACPQ